MDNKLAQGEMVQVGNKEILFSDRVIRNRYRMRAPASFAEDKNLVSNYTYLFSQDKSPLSIAIKFSPAAAREEKEKQILVYFSQAADTLETNEEHSARVYYRETVSESKFLSVYSLRFAVEEKDGLLFGCFNCSAKYRDDWRPVVLNMLGNIKPV